MMSKLSLFKVFVMVKPVLNEMKNYDACFIKSGYGMSLIYLK